MALAAYYPYRSEAARDRCFAYLDTAAADIWPADSEERTVATTYGPTFVRVTGPIAAQPLVLLHGAGATSLMWRPNIKAFSARFRTFAVDQIGEFGRSLCTTPPRNMSDLTTWLDQLFDGLKLRSGINLAGMSYGGALAANYALRFPARLRKLVLIAPGNTVLRTSAEFWARLICAAIPKWRGIPSFMRWIFADMAREDPKWIDAVVREFFLNMDNVERHRAVMPPVFTDSQWRLLGVPTLFLVGEHDRIYSARKAVMRLRRVAPSVTPEIVAGAGHDLTFLQADPVNRRIVDFLAQPMFETAAAAS